MRKLFVIILFVGLLNAKEITPSVVYSQVMLITDEIHFLLKHYGIDHAHEKIIKRNIVNSKLKPRNVWQKSYEIMIKINILRSEHGLPIVKPVNMTPVLNLNPNLVYEQTQRILTELEIFKFRNHIESPRFKVKEYKNKTPLDVFNGLNHISMALDEINQIGFTPSYVFAENMRVYEDITAILHYLDIEDKTIPAKKNINATPNDTFNTALKTLEKIKQLQMSASIDYVDFNSFRKKKQTPSDVFSMTQMIIAELQTIKAYIGLNIVLRSADDYISKTPVEVDQLMSWNLRKLNLIKNLSKGNQ